MTSHMFLLLPSAGNSTRSISLADLERQLQAMPGGVIAEVVLPTDRRRRAARATLERQTAFPIDMAMPIPVAKRSRTRSSVAAH